MSNRWSVLALILVVCCLSHLTECLASSTPRKERDALSSDICSTLANQFPGKVELPTDAEYASNLLTYYSEQEQKVHPACIISPNSTLEVSAIINSIREHNATFAIRSGGHALNAGAANIENGVTINLRAMNALTTDAAGARVYIGPGLKWTEIYARLDRLGLVIPGGRDGDVGVGGLLTGGGISFFSGRFGWACDSVDNFEVVVASGAIINANAYENSDLFQALKGGSNNFGIVTRFDVRAFPLKEFYGGQIITPEIPGVPSTVPGKIKGFADLLANRDPYAAVILNFGWTPQVTFVSTVLQYTKPGVVDPPVFAPFTHAPDPVHLIDSVRVANLSSFAAELSASPGYGSKYQWATSTFTGDEAMIITAHKLWNASISALPPGTKANWFAGVQLFPVTASQPNAFGIPNSSESSKLAVFLLIYFGYSAEEEAAITKIAQKLIADIEAAAKKAGKYNAFKYLNYAAYWQDPISAYGNLAAMREVSKVYDPSGLFQKNCPGGFKIPVL
ncbi:FAD-binding protein [Glarea lozoyensis ATCC 20868]|uniref:FAD-binding protein n=1 Tax=Glarea lozoyensis (strain ATCC 20868 / MF5171) TaxID=1116229 RepID=S3D224_GLAL2|nr:FAD-binding protein [Glarea lozoyensis ATCC 20868]EPE31845.1 FAD-binding protein [Glarea lozoyensis ATCC 20868]